MAGEPGFEPGLPGPEPGVLPLNYSPREDIKLAFFWEIGKRKREIDYLFLVILEIDALAPDLFGGLGLLHRGSC